MAHAQLSSSWARSALQRRGSRLAESTGVLQRAGWDREPALGCRLLHGKISASGVGSRGCAGWARVHPCGRGVRLVLQWKTRALLRRRCLGAL